MTRDDALVLAAVIVTSAVALLRWSGLPVEYWMAAVCIPVLLAIAVVKFASAAVDVARLVRDAVREVR